MCSGVCPISKTGPEPVIHSQCTPAPDRVIRAFMLYPYRWVIVCSMYWSIKKYHLATQSGKEAWTNTGNEGGRKKIMVEGFKVIFKNMSSPIASYTCTKEMRERK